MKTICVPKNSLAQEHLDFDQSEANELTELNLDDKTFNRLLESGFFSAINMLTNSNIDNFEDESIIGDKLLLKVLKSKIFDKETYDDELFKIVNKIKDLFNEALKCKTGIYFYF